MTGASPFIESVWLVVANLEIRLVVEVLFPVILLGVMVKFIEANFLRDHD
jgi:hypothetical protein